MLVAAGGLITVFRMAVMIALVAEASVGGVPGAMIAAAVGPGLEGRRRNSQRRLPA